MEIQGKSILILGGWGLVGMALCRDLIKKKPGTIIIASLKREEAESACAELKPGAGRVRLIPEWGDIFVRTEFKDKTRESLMNDPDSRMKLIEDSLERTGATSFSHFFLYDMIIRHRPNIVLDCVNTATGVAYQNIYDGGLKVLKGARTAREGKVTKEYLADVEKLLATLYIPQLVRHVQVIYHAMKDAGTGSYVKVGTSGTGGMGLNIPYTHSEDKPSRVLLSKTCIGGAHSLLLFLMGRTPDAPYVKEIKPAAAIAWKRIVYDEVYRHGKPIPLYDRPLDSAVKLEGKFCTADDGKSVDLKTNMKAVLIDTGENGTFSVGEFKALSTAEQMEFVTPEEISRACIAEIEGGNSGHDIVGALDAAVLSPSYRAGFMRHQAIEKLHNLAQKTKDDTVAFELLGPPRLSKLLWEAYILRRIAKSVNGVLRKTPQELSAEAEELVKTDLKLRSRVISIGIPILLADGVTLLRGPFIKVPQDARTDTFDATRENMDKWSSGGWVDLRISNMFLWQERLKALKKEAKGVGRGNTSSQYIRDYNFWHFDRPIDEGELVGWLFIEEDKGRRIK